MSFGFSVVNSDNNIIISDYTKNFHFLGRANLMSTSSTKITSFPNYSGAYAALDGRTIFTYRIASIEDPLVFIKPTEYSNFYGIVRKYVVGSLWYIIVIGTGANPSAPILNCFASANAVGKDDVGGQGLVVYKQDTYTRTFDSRYNPLAITGSGTQVPPEDPTNSPGFPRYTSGHPWNYATLDHDFRSTNRYNSYEVNGEYDKIMFSSPSLAQATWYREMAGYKKSKADFWDWSTQEHWSNARWWVMYRNLFRLSPSANTGKAILQSGWGPYAAGYAFSSRYEDGGWFGGGGGSYSTGSAPYEQKTINLTPNVFITASSTGYI
jgi:hypothetical protein